VTSPVPLDAVGIAKALVEPASKLIEAVRSGIGVIYEPTRKRREAKANADTLLIRVGAELDAQDLVSQRMATRVVSTELRRQYNIDAIVEKAFDALPESATAESADPDWIAQFFESCHDVSNDQMQRLWAKILAGEVAKPGHFSRRLLSIVKEMSPRYANVFTALRGLAFVGEPDYWFVPVSDANGTNLVEYGITYDASMELQSIGLINAGPSLRLTVSGDVTLRYGDRSISCSVHPSLNAHVPMYSLTSAGAELAAVIPFTPNGTYFEVAQAMICTALRIPIPPAQHS
jgi:Protein of unknown function (DUF2806)